MTLLGHVHNEIDLWTLSAWLGRGMTRSRRSTPSQHGFARLSSVVVEAADEAVRPTTAGLWLRGPAG